MGHAETCTAALTAAEAVRQPVICGEFTAVALTLGDAQAGDRRRRADVLTVARHGDPFSSAELDLLEHLAAQAAVSLENIDLHELVQRQAITDELTGLLNHRRLQQVLGEALIEGDRAQQPVALLMLDIDNFKRVNDTHGHRQGDAVLTRVADALRSVSRPDDHAGRYGGEEMALVLPNTTLEEAGAIAERVRTAIETLDVRLAGGDQLAVTASLGVAAFPSCAGDRGALIEAADAAMYEAKRSGKNRVVAARTVVTTGRFARSAHQATSNERRTV
jgi:diguanylate cyclase (GGDEF)-like protein